MEDITSKAFDDFWKIGRTPVKIAQTKVIPSNSKKYFIRPTATQPILTQSQLIKSRQLMQARANKKIIKFSRQIIRQGIKTGVPIIKQGIKTAVPVIQRGINPGIKYIRKKIKYQNKILPKKHPLTNVPNSIY